MLPLDSFIKQQLQTHLTEIEQTFNADLLTIISPISYGLDLQLNNALKNLTNKKEKIVIIHDTEGGIVEVVERMVNAIRHYYKHVTFIIPDRAMSAGTIFALSGNRILMDYFSCLGPIDPQIQKDGKFVPALAYLEQFDRLNNLAKLGQLTTAEYALLNQFDLGELYQFEQAKELSRDLLVKWLSNYKFKDWKTTSTNKTAVTPDMKQEAAANIANILSNNKLWHSHSRPINMETLINAVNIQIEDYHQIPEYPGLGKLIQEYFELLKDYMNRSKIVSFIHTRDYF